MEENKLNVQEEINETGGSVIETENPVVDATEEAIITDVPVIEQEQKNLKTLILPIISILLFVGILVGIVFGVKQYKLYQQDKQAIENVEQLITSIGTVSADAECAVKIEKAAKAYNSLSDTQKTKVENHSTLTTANDTYTVLKYYQDLVNACNFVNKKAEASMEIFDDIKTLWNNVIYDEYDEYNKGKYELSSAVDEYWSSPGYLSNSLLLFDDFNKDSNGKTLSEYLALLKNPPAQYSEAYTAFTALYAAYSPMPKLTKSINHTYSSYSNEISTLSKEYRVQFGKVKAIIPEVNHY